MSLSIRSLEIVGPPPAVEMGPTEVLPATSTVSEVGGFPSLSYWHVRRVTAEGFTPFGSVDEVDRASMIVVG
jgi:hypothetical protein